MAKGAALLGGEEVGGVMWPEVSLAKDGFLTAAKIVEALGEKSLSEWVRELPVYYNEKTKIAVGENQKTGIIAAVLEHAKKNKLKFTGIDGVRIDFEDCWVIVRPSGTENYMRIFAEARTQKKAKQLLEEYVALAKK